MNANQPTISIIPSRSLLAADQESVLDVLIRIAAPQQEPRRERRPLNLGIVLDRSGSMQGEKLRNAAEAVAFAVRNMHGDDRVSLTVYDDEVQTPVPSAPVAKNRPALLEILPRIRAGHATALHDGWVQGGLQVSEHLEPGRLSRVLLISDGLANEGERRTEVLVTRARELFDKGVSTSTIGVGTDFNEDLMIPMARDGGGNGWFIESPADFTRIFQAELQDLARVFGEKARLRLEPRGRRAEVIEVLNDFQSDGDGYLLGTLFAGSPLEIVAHIKARGGEMGQPLDLFDVRLSWEAPGEGRAEMQQLFRMECDDPAKVAGLPVSAEVSRVVELLKSARLRRRAVKLMDAGQFAAVRALFHEQQVIWQEVYARTGDADSLLEVQEIEQLAMAAENAEFDRSSRSSARKYAQYQAQERLARSRRRT
jgi:Ca-activated chloride channel family protein